MEGGPPLFSAGFTCPQILRILPSIFAFRLQGYHLLWPAFPYRSTMLSSISAVLTPKVLLPSVWPLPISLAATLGISVDFFSSAYLDVSVQRVSPRIAMYSLYGCGSLLPQGFPIRISVDRCLFATPHRFSQLITSFFAS